MSGRFIPGVFVAVVSVVAVALVWMGVRDDYESFTPPAATAVDRADCLDSDIATALVAPEARDNSSALRSEGSGYPLLISALLLLFDANAVKRPTVD